MESRNPSLAAPAPATNLPLRLVLWSQGPQALQEMEATHHLPLRSAIAAHGLRNGRNPGSILGRYLGIRSTGEQPLRLAGHQRRGSCPGITSAWTTRDALSGHGFFSVSEVRRMSVVSRSFMHTKAFTVFPLIFSLIGVYNRRMPISARYKLRIILIGLFLSSTFVFGQDGFISNWSDMVTRTENEQPHWIVPLATTTPTLHQLFRYDIQWQIHNGGVTTDNFGVSKGLEIIPEKHVEVVLAVPPYIVNNPGSSKDGFGDWQFLVKYRIAAANEEHGNYILTVFYQMSFPTGQYKQGALNTIMTPTVAYGKGFKDFSVQGTLGGSLPTGNTATIGRTILWNNALQYRVLKKIWPEIEFNFTHYYEGSHDRHSLLYVTPGIVFGKFPIHNRFSFIIGGGFQIAATSFHPTNHNEILSIRFPF